MDAFEICGGEKLYGSVKIDFAKNSLLPLISASVATGSTVCFPSFPNYRDTEVLLSIAEHGGAKVERKNGGVKIDSSSFCRGVFPDKLFREVRASIFMLGGVLARLGYAECPLPGGCRIGDRPINLHLEALEQMGANIRCDGEKVVCRADGLHGAKIVLPFPSVGVTENVMIAACLADGDTEIHNAAIEPEVMDLKNFLNECGGKIATRGRTFYIGGVKKLTGCEYTPIKDRIEAGTFLYATALVGGEVVINCVPEKKICSFVAKSGNNACKIKCFNGNIYISAKGTPFSCTKISTSPYPGYPTDMQSQVVALLSVAKGESIVSDTVFPERFACVEQLKQLGADIKVKNGCAIVSGVRSLKGARVKAEDLRGGAGLVLACLKADGLSAVENAELIDRGYAAIEDKLSALGAKIKRIKNYRG